MGHQEEFLQRKTVKHWNGPAREVVELSSLDVAFSAVV